MGREDYSGPENFVLRTLEPGFLFLALYGPGFFSVRIIRIKTKQKTQIYMQL